MSTQPRLDTGRVPLRRIRRLVRQIVERFDPERVILFGSYAYGRPTPDSDVDLMVVMHTDQRPVDQAIEISRALDQAFPMDLLVRTPEEFARRLALGDFFLRDVAEKGRVLYDRTRR